MRSFGYLTLPLRLAEGMDECDRKRASSGGRDLADLQEVLFECPIGEPDFSVPCPPVLS
jgi:hypothetical protein